MIHSIVDYTSNDFESLKATEILKLSLLSVKVMYGKIHNNWDSKPRWSSVEAAQWKRTFIWLAHRLWDFWPFSNLSPDELAALQQLARSAWGEIPDPTEDSSQEVLPLPDYFYLMLWWTAGKDLSQIPSQHPQLLQIAHTSSDEQYDIRSKGRDMAWAYEDNPGNLYPPGTEDDNGYEAQEIRTSPPPQDIQDPIPNDPGADAELDVAGGSQPELHTDISVSFMLSFVSENLHDSLHVWHHRMFSLQSPELPQKLESEAQKQPTNFSRPVQDKPMAASLDKHHLPCQFSHLRAVKV